MSTLSSFFGTDGKENDENVKNEEMQDIKGQIEIIKIKDVNDAKKPIDYLMDGKAVIVDASSLKSANKSDAYSYITGACYGAKSQFTVIAPQIYLLTPRVYQVIVDSEKPVNTHKIDFNRDQAQKNHEELAKNVEKDDKLI